MAVQKLIQEYGSEFDWESNNKFINDSLRYQYFQGGEYFRSGRDALKAIALKFKGQYKRVLLPTLCCESMVKPFEMNGYEISYFKLNYDISAEFGDVLSKIDSDTIFLYMNYFGIPSLSDMELKMIRDQFLNTIIIEDRTHDVLMHRNCEFIPDYTVFSIRKWLAIPDGGILYSHCKQEGFPKEEDSYFGDVRTNALKNKSEYLKSGNSQIKRLFRNQLEEANSYLDKNEAVAAISPKSYELLQKINFEQISQYRHKNTLTYSQCLKNSSSVKRVSTETGKSGLYYPILVENRDVIQRDLAAQNIYCPVIWPLPKEAIGICEVSDYISNNMLALPCDQRYRKSDIQYICNVLEQLLENDK